MAPPFPLRTLATPTKSSVHRLTDQALIKVNVTMPLTVSQSVSLGVKPHLGLMTRYLLLCGSYSLVFVGLPL
jgi:hypothetical protein